MADWIQKGIVELVPETLNILARKFQFSFGLARRIEMGTKRWSAELLRVKAVGDVVVEGRCGC
jgi:hypothetical protein